MTDIDLTDSRHILPGGYDARHVTEPPAPDTWAVGMDDLREMWRAAGSIRLSADLMGPDGDLEVHENLRAGISSTAGNLQRMLRILTGGALVLALAVVGLVAGPTAGRAEAAEGPEPDPVAAVSVGVRTVPVTLSSAVVTARIPVSTTHVTPAGWHCAAVFSARLGFVGRACSLLPSYVVAVRLDARAVPVGRSTLTVVDDVAPFDGLLAQVTLVARRPSRFGVGTWGPTYYGDGLTVTAPLFMYSPAAGQWLPQQASPVQVQELRAGRWVTVATFTTNRRGIATGSVTLGGGLHTVRVARVTGATVTATVGTAHTFYLVPTDVPVDVI